MSEQPPQRDADLSLGTRRRLATISVARSALAVTSLLVVYYAAPLDRQLDAGTWLRFGAGLLGFAAVALWQIRSVGRSGFPRLRGIQAAATGLTLLIVLYAATYSLISVNRPDAFSEALSRTDALYFTVTVFATVGFGDIAPRSELARVVTTTQMLVGLLALGLVAKVLWGAVETAVRRRGPRLAGEVSGPPADDGRPAVTAAGRTTEKRNL